ncbi:unnamed protein product [Paramecium primaurelia]|uniref:MICOS complex subunit MIC10 n=2 Tax=Paramecium TaxID=5884 RepID=A0A8S1VNC2_9CILI|nr:unnamed protein product [Paramecium primaurelia]CAD8177109.1 unnamed protein product [Paramecium pentaurelia]
MDRQLKLDTQLNKTAFDLVTYTTVGYFVGVAASVFFKRRAFIRNLSAGVFAGFAFNENQEAFNRQL